ncbi:MAG: twin-arginine translocase TatA/TatE family subunit [Actinobacteria bacterium]|nr:twin-arginine translocase TatA/TatE family subunit [Actinomycetota bacterium]
MPGFVGFPELVLLGLVVLLLFGPKRLPEIGRGLGKGLREFKDSVSGDHKDEDINLERREISSDASVTTPTAWIPQDNEAPATQTAAVPKNGVT